MSTQAELGFDHSSEVSLNGSTQHTPPSEFCAQTQSVRKQIEPQSIVLPESGTNAETNVQPIHIDPGQLVNAIAQFLDPEGYAKYQYWQERNKALNKFLAEDEASQDAIPSVTPTKKPAAQTRKEERVLGLVPRALKPAVAAAAALLALSAGNGANTDQGTLGTDSQQSTGIHKVLTDGLDTVKNLIKTTEAALPEDSYGPEVTREWLEQNPQDILATTDIKDNKGSVTKQYVVVKKVYDSYNNLWNSVIYETSRDSTTGLFTTYEAVSKIPIENIGSLTSNSDGSILIAGGETPIRSLNTTVSISYDSGKTWKTINWPYQPSGPTGDLVPLSEDNTGNTILGNNSPFEHEGVGQFLLRVNKSNQTATIQATNLETIQKVNISVGGARDLSLTSIDPVNHTVEFASNGSATQQTGIKLYRVDYTTGNGTVESIGDDSFTSPVYIDGVATNLGWLYGRATYTDPQGHMHFVSANHDRNLIYNVDLETRTGTQFNCGNLLDGRGIPNYGGGFHVNSIDIITDAQVNKQTWLGGSYASSIDYMGRAVLYHLESGIFYDLAPNSNSGVWNMQRKTINGQLGYEFPVGIGKAFVPINSDGTPSPDRTIYWTDKGLDNPLASFTVYLPLVSQKPN